MFSRRKFMKHVSQAGLVAASSPLWSNVISSRAFAQMASTYKAIVVVTLTGGNDGNNTIIPLDAAEYRQYAALRGPVAIPQAQCLALNSRSFGPAFGMHPALTNIASLYNSGNALVVANVGPLRSPLTKFQLLQAPDSMPQSLLSHPAGVAQWESASTLALPATGWGGRIADLVASQSGALPPVFDAGQASIFTVGRSVQAIALQSGIGATTTAIPVGLQAAILAIAQDDSLSQNAIVAQAANLRVQAMNQQALILQAQNSGIPLQTQFPQTTFGQRMQAIASVINGRSVIGASRQIFYTQQGIYDTHQSQLGAHASCLAELDGGVGAFIQALQEMGLQNDVLVCTHSDFNRTYVSNVSGGTDHAWGNHQVIIGHGLKGGQIIGAMPDLDLNGSSDFNGYGTWIPSLSVTQMTAGIGGWLGLSTPQLASVFPDLANFSQGAIVLV
jgi:uncharacterized protein (DUF1501 family)